MLIHKPNIWHLNAIAIALTGLPALILLILALYPPDQYLYTLYYSSNNSRLTLISISVGIIFSFIYLMMLSCRALLTPATALPAVSTTIAVVLSLLKGSASSVATLIAVPVAGVVLLGLYKIARTHPPRTLWLPVLIAVGCFSVFAIGNALEPIMFSRAAGALAVFVVFLGTVTTLVVAALLRPLAGLLGLAYCAFALVFFAPGNHDVPVRPIPDRSSPPPPQEIEKALGVWLDSRADLKTYKALNRPYPVIFVSSEGGGIYAAAHAYQALTILSRHCANFSQHVFATVGVSGGAIGNALFAAEVNPTQTERAGCATDAPALDLAALSDDHFSPTLARMLLLESIDRLLPGRWINQDRAAILVDSFRASLKHPEFLDRWITESWQPDLARPAVVAISTGVADGTRFMLGPLRIDSPGENSRGTWWPNSEIPGGRETTILAAAATAARFPWITPTARLQLNETHSAVLADGGYFENSGAETILDMISALWQFSDEQTYYSNNLCDDKISLMDNKINWDPPEIDKCKLIIHANAREKIEWTGCDYHIFPVHLAITSTQIDSEEGDIIIDDEPSFLLDPLTTFLNTRTARGALALHRAKLEMCGTAGGECVRHPGGSTAFFASIIDPSKLNLPLGWHLSPEKAAAIGADAIPADLFRYLDPAEDHVSNLTGLLRVLDPDSDRDGVSPTVDKARSP